MKGALGRPQTARPLRVLAVANWDMTASPVPWASQRIEGLRRAGASVEVLAEECVADRRGFLRLWRTLDRKLAGGDFDVVVPLYGAVLGLLCALQRRVPCALSFAGSDLNGTRSADGRLELGSVPSLIASQLAAALAGGVSVHNRGMLDRLWWPPARRASESIPDGVDTRRFRPSSRDEARLALGLPVEGTRVAFVALHARERASKRLDLAQAAVDRLPGAALDVIDGVPFAKMPLCYAAADALLFTSCQEGSPNCVKEALACAVPVISVDVGDVREVLSGLTNCAVVEAEPGALAAALARAIADGRGCPDGPKRMADEHSLDRIAARFVGFYRRVAG